MLKVNLILTMCLWSVTQALYPLQPISGVFLAFGSMFCSLFESRIAVYTAEIVIIMGLLFSIRFVTRVINILATIQYHGGNLVLSAPEAP